MKKEKTKERRNGSSEGYIYYGKTKIYTALKVPRQDSPVLVNSGTNWIVLNVKQRGHGQLLLGLTVDMDIGYWKGCNKVETR